MTPQPPPFKGRYYGQVEPHDGVDWIWVGTRWGDVITEPPTFQVAGAYLGHTVQVDGTEWTWMGETWADASTEPPTPR